MAIPKVMGIETEYGITVKNQPDFNPILSSLLLINSYETFRSSRVRWDYEAESPLRDARGFEYMEEKEGTSKEESRLINLILSNGARFYVDHAHPEYSSPETTNPRDLVIWDRAGERILNLSRQRAEAVSPPEQRILIYKNNTDSKGNSYGTHENYLMDRRVPFARIVQHMMPFFVTRQIFTGAGKVGAENNADPCDYQISQRADFLETEVGLETMHSRPIINTRDEPHADPEKYRRLHVIVGDANMSEVSNYLKTGTMAIVLSMIEDDFIDRDLSLDSPVLSYRRVSRDLNCRETMRLKDGRALTAVDLQREFLDMAHRYYREREHEPWVDDVMARWQSVLDRLARVPLAAPEIAGMLNLRGRIVTAIDMRRRLGLMPIEDDKPRMAVGIESKGESYGLLIDAIGEVLKLEAASCEDNPVNLDAGLARVSAGVHRLNGSLMVVLDVDRVLEVGAYSEAA